MEPDMVRLVCGGFAVLLLAVIVMRRRSKGSA
jgi:hypothetical protein